MSVVAITDPQKLMEEAVVGSRFPMHLYIDNNLQNPVQVHCTETLLNPAGQTHIKKFTIFSNGVNIGSTQATKEDGKWFPK